MKASRLGKGRRATKVTPVGQGPNPMKAPRFSSIRRWRRVSKPEVASSGPAWNIEKRGASHEQAGGPPTYDQHLPARQG